VFWFFEANNAKRKQKSVGCGSFFFFFFSTARRLSGGERVLFRKKKTCKTAAPLPNPNLLREMRLRAKVKELRAEHNSKYPKYGELCLHRMKPEETLVEVRSVTDVQIVRHMWV